MDDSQVIADLVQKANGGDGTALNQLRREVDIVIRAVERRFSKIKTYRKKDIAEVAFIEAVQTYDPDKGTFIRHFRRTYYTRLLDAVKVKSKSDHLVKSYHHIRDETGETFESIFPEESIMRQVEFGEIKEFIVVVIGYALTNEFRSLQAILNGETFECTADRYKVSAQVISRGFISLLALAELYQEGQVPWPSTPESIAQVRRKVKFLVESKRRTSQLKDVDNLKSDRNKLRRERLSQRRRTPKEENP